MRNLLKPGSIKKEGKGLELNLYQLSGHARPKIEGIENYHWSIQVKGTKKYSYVKELRIGLLFFGKDKDIDTRYFEIVDYIPRREQEELATLELTFPQVVNVSLPIKQDKIDSEKSPTKISWTFKDIDLSNSDTLSRTFEGVVQARFFRHSFDEKIGIAISVLPEFYEKQYFRKKPCNLSISIDSNESKELCEDIIPGDPVKGFADLEEPDSKKLFIYDYLIDEGILQKGTGSNIVRNVSLRAKTLSILFDKLKDDLEYQNYYKVIKNVGRETGCNFAEELKKILGHVPTIPEWFDYDSSAGMGRFEINEGKTEIIVKNSFLTFDAKKSDKPICCFLEGYFESMLNEIMSKTNTVVIETNCKSKGDKYCRFKIN